MRSSFETRAPAHKSSDLVIGRRRAALEREADRAADHIVRGGHAPALSGAGPAIQRKCAACEDDVELMRRDDSGAGSTVNAPSRFAAMTGGAPLDRTTRAYVEPRFGADFSGVRVHTDASAGALARDARAHAYTVGKDIVFAPGQYAPGTAPGMRLLAHELAHVVQQSMAPGPLLQRDAEHGTEDRELEVLERDDDEEEEVEVDEDEDNAPLGAADRTLFGAPGHGSKKTKKSKTKKKTKTKTPSRTSKAAAPAVPKCTKITSDPIASHKASKTALSKIGDATRFDLEFSCLPVDKVRSHIEDSSGRTVEGSQKDMTVSKSGKLTRAWDVKELFSKQGQGKLQVDDETYTHVVDRVVVAFTAKATVTVTTGPNFTSPGVKVSTRAKTGKQDTADNVTGLAKILEGEVAPTVVHKDEQTAVAWAVRNQMYRIQTNEVGPARAFFQDATVKSPSSTSTSVAKAVLAQSLSSDPTGGAIKWYSPRKMTTWPTPCKTKPKPEDCRGGHDKVLDTETTGKLVEKWKPSWAKTMTEQTPTGLTIDPWYLRIFSL